MLAPGSEIIGGSNTNLFAMMSDVAGQVTDLNQSALKPLLQTLNNKIEKLGGILEVQAPQLMANLVAVSGDLAQKTPHITADVERMTGTMSTKVVNDANARHISESLENLQNLTQGMVETRHKLDSAMTNLDKMVGGNRETIDASFKDLRYTLQTLARSIDSITYNLEGTTRNFNEFSRQLRDNPGILIGGRRTEDGPKK